MRSRRNPAFVAGAFVRSIITVLMMLLLGAAAHGAVFVQSALAILEAEDCADSENEEQTRDLAPKLFRLRPCRLAHGPVHGHSAFPSNLIKLRFPIDPPFARAAAMPMGAGVALRC